MNPATHAAFLDELEKIALLERLVRLGATDIPNTPRMLMRQRSPQELASLQHGVSNYIQKHVNQPLGSMGEKLVSKLPGKIQPLAGKVTGTIAKNPEMLLFDAVPVPGSSMAYLGLKRGAEKLIDRFSPAHALEAAKVAALNEELAFLMKEAGIGDMFRAGRNVLSQKGQQIGQRLMQSGNAVTRGLGHSMNIGSMPLPQAGHAMGALGNQMKASPSSFAQGVGGVLAHKGHAIAQPGMKGVGSALWNVGNAPGAVAEAVTAGAGTAASKGLAATGGRLQQVGAGLDAVHRQGMAMTPKGRLMNAFHGTAQRAGQGLQSSFQAGGMGHKTLTNYLPRATEIAAPALAGIPTAAGLLGGGMLSPAGAAVTKALGTGGAHVVADALGTMTPHVGRGVLGRAAGLLGGAA